MNPSITYLKALGITLMVLGHCCCSIPYAVQFLYMFHMPLFFFASGYCFKERYLHESRTFVWKRIKGIYWPYVKWSLLFLAMHNVFYHLNIYSADYGWKGMGSHLYDIHNFKGCAFGIITSMSCHEQLLGGYWFLNALFFGSLIAFTCLKTFKRPEIGGVCA